MRIARLALIAFAAVLTGCSYALTIDGFPPTPSAAVASATPHVVGVMAASADPATQGYVDAIARGLQTQASVRRVVHPFGGGGEVDVVAVVEVTPKYKGAGINFLINFPGFLVWAPAWNGYEYHANPVTRVELRTPDGKPFDTITFEHDYEFHQADIGRTWTEISWLEAGIIAFVGGIVFTNYDSDPTEPFIAAVGPRYGSHVATLIGNRLAQGPAR